MPSAPEGNWREKEERAISMAEDEMEKWKQRYLEFIEYCEDLYEDLYDEP